MNALKIHFDCFHNQVNNLDDMEREQHFNGHKIYGHPNIMAKIWNILEKFKCWLLLGDEICKPKLVSSKYL